MDWELGRVAVDYCHKPTFKHVSRSIYISVLLLISYGVESGKESKTKVNNEHHLVGRDTLVLVHFTSKTNAF